jgi:hypothetical protein
VPTSEHFNRLAPHQAEALALLAEECGEVIHLIGKVLRHGLESCHPDGGECNRVLLGQEVGDALAAVRIAEACGVINPDEVSQAVDRKLRSVTRYLHHVSPMVVNAIAERTRTAPSGLTQEEREALEHAYMCVMQRADGPLTPTARAKYERTIAAFQRLLASTAPAPAGGPPLDAAQREIKTCHEMLDSNRDVLPAGLLPERLSALLADIDRMTSQLRADREVPASVMEMPMDAAARVRDGARPAPAPASGGRPVTRAQVDACLARHGRAVIDRGIGLVIDDILCDLGITVIATPATAEGEGGDGE